MCMYDWSGYSFLGAQASYPKWWKGKIEVNHWCLNVMREVYGEYEMIYDLLPVGHVNVNRDWWMTWPCGGAHKCLN